MVTTEPSPARPRPTSLYAGVLAEAWGAARTGRLTRAVELLADLDPAGLDERTRALHGVLLLTSQLGLGDVAAAVSTGEALRRLPAADEAAAVAIRLALGDLATALGDHGAALDQLRSVGRSAHAEDPDLAAWRPGAAIAAVRIGDRVLAVELARAELARAEELAAPHRLAVALRTLATVDSAADPILTLRRAAGLAEHADDPRLRAQIDTDLAGLLLLAPGADPVGHRAELLGLLRPAEAFAAAEGLLPLHARIRRLLDRVGEEAVPVGVPALSLLTTAERRVARLAATGLTNREIAQQLAVTVKGVEWHLSRVYRKLGIGSRAGLGPVLEAV